MDKDRARWNDTYTVRGRPNFAPHPLAVTVLGDLPAGPVLELACGPSGSALLAAARGHHVTAVDVSDVALGQLGAEAERRGLAESVTLIRADLDTWRPAAAGYALVLCTSFWDPDVFAAAASAVRHGGMLAWETFTIEALTAHPGLRPQWCLRPGEPASLLPAGFTVREQRDADNGKRRLISLRSGARHPRA